MMYTQQQFDEHVAKARQDAYQKAFDAERAKGVKAERVRLAAILFGPEAKGREATAQALAFDSGDLSAEAAIQILKTLPRTLKQSLPGDRARNAAGGLVFADGQEIDPTAAFEHGQEIAASLPREMLKR